MAVSRVMEAITPILLVVLCMFSVQSTAAPMTTSAPLAENSTAYHLNEVVRGTETLKRFTVSDTFALNTITSRKENGSQE